jgi:hypothetical protein
VSVAEIVTCTRCLKDWPEDDEGVRWSYGDWYCNYENDCDDRIAAREELDAI